jgi:glycosyltransferase involved in cell wall biosynthesis
VELSVVIPCLNEAETLGTCIGKALRAMAEHGIDGEVVVADNGSTDGSQDIASELGARVVWSGELTESSLIPFASQLRTQLGVSGAEYLESALIDGDTEAGASTNINDIDGTAAATDWFMVWNGFRKSCLVTTTANSRSAAGSLDITDYLQTVNLMGTGRINGVDRSKVGFIVDVPTYYKTMQLPEVLTRDVFVSPTIEGGQLTGRWGYSLNYSGQICKNGGAGGLSEATGKCDETAGDNLYGQILAVRWNQWKFGWRRRMTMETTRFANSDSNEIVAMMRCGLIQRDTEASAITYYVGV